LSEILTSNDALATYHAFIVLVYNVLLISIEVSSYILSVLINSDDKLVNAVASFLYTLLFDKFND
jgi:hypothetical protein